MFLNSIKHRLEEFQKDVKVKGEVERDLESCFVELEKVEADYQVSMLSAADSFSIPISNCSLIQT